jgi:hypothetical protein
MKLKLIIQEVERLMGFKVHHDGVKLVVSLRVAECGILHEIEVNINLMVQMKERLEAL